MTRDTHTCCRALNWEAVTTFFNDLSLPKTQPYVWETNALTDSASATTSMLVNAITMH